jgi:DNA-binding response OmpR family regulator
MAGSDRVASRGKWLDGKRVLITEDEYLIAADLMFEVTAAGGKVVGTSGSVDAALDFIAAGNLDGAILDIRLMGQRSFRVADVLAARQIPFIFATAMSHHDAPPRHANVHWLEKPWTRVVLRKALEDAMSFRDEGAC